MGAGVVWYRLEAGATQQDLEVRRRRQPGWMDGFGDGGQPSFVGWGRAPATPLSANQRGIAKDSLPRHPAMIGPADPPLGRSGTRSCCAAILGAGPLLHAIQCQHCVAMGRQVHNALLSMIVGGMPGTLLLARPEVCRVSSHRIRGYRGSPRSCPFHHPVPVVFAVTEPHSGPSFVKSALSWRHFR